MSQELNAPVVSDTTTATPAGDGPQTFEELDRAIQAKTKADREAKSSAKPKEVKPDEKTDKSKDLSSDDDKGKKAEPKAKEAKGSKDKEEEPEKEEAAKPKKTLKYKAGEAEADIDEDALFTVTINGKPEQVTAREIINNYSGKVAWDKKFQEVDRKSKDFEGKYNSVQAKIKAAFEEKDPNQRLWKMAEVAGVNPVQFKKFYLDDNMELLEKWYSMSEEDKKSYLLEEENKYLKTQSETYKTEIETKASQEKTLKEITGLLASHSVKDEDFWNTYGALAEAADEGKLEVDGIKSRDQITPKKVLEFYQKEQLWNHAEEAMSTTQVPADKRAAIIGRLVDMSHAQGLTKEDISDMISELYGAKKTQNKIQEKVKQDTEFKTGKKDLPNRNSKEPLFFGDL